METAGGFYQSSIARVSVSKQRVSRNREKTGVWGAIRAQNRRILPQISRVFGKVEGIQEGNIGKVSLYLASGYAVFG